MDNEIKSIDMTLITDAASYTWAVDSAIRSGTMSNLGESRVHSFASVVDSAIKSGTASTFETSLVHSFSSLLDTAIKSDTALSFGTSRVHSFASRVRRDQLSHSMPHYDDDSGNGDDDDDNNDEDDGDDHDDDEYDLSDFDKSKSSPSGTDTKKEPPVPKDVPTPEIAAQVFRFRELAAATKNFRPEYLLGEGGFGPVYKGRLESTGQVIAIKQLDRSGRQGTRQFLTEILMLSSLHHPNLVNLIGSCADGDKMLVVYEFMPLGSLEGHLHDIPPDQEPLDWNTRIKIVTGAAKGLEYLHEKANLSVIHRDLKSSNILLDEGYHPKLSDFGLAKLGPVGDETHLSTVVMGTYGYVAPEYARTGTLSLKSDVYSFGVVLLELITGRKAIDNTRPHGEHNLVAWVRPLFKDRRNCPKMVDPMLQGRYPIQGLYLALAVAAMCLRDQPATRPPIRDVVAALTYLASQTYDPNATNESNRVGSFRSLIDSAIRSSSASSTDADFDLLFHTSGLSGPDDFEIQPAPSQQAQAQQDHVASPPPPPNTINLQQPLLQTEDTLNAVTPPVLPLNTDESNSSRNTKKETPVPKGRPTAHIAAQIFTFRELAVATKNFRPECLLRQGGFGSVYKGRLESTGQVVAVKQLDQNGLRGKQEFLVEILMLRLLHHPNLVNLIGDCADADQRLLVYEFLPLGSLEDHLHDLPPDKEPLDWNTRMKIAAGTAKGLEYLHDMANPPVIHRNLKPSNILLDEGYNPKLSDFGLAKLGPVGDKTHVSTRVMGTVGYIAPEYAMTGQLTLKSDIYSFGVVLLELLTGRKAIDNTRELGEHSLIAWARPLFKDWRNFPKMADPLLQGRYPMQRLYQALAVAAMCLQDQAAARPLIGDVATVFTFLSSQTVKREEI